LTLSIGGEFTYKYDLGYNFGIELEIKIWVKVVDLNLYYLSLYFRFVLLIKKTIIRFTKISIGKGD
jgi:hypothetical protein